MLKYLAFIGMFLFVLSCAGTQQNSNAAKLEVSFSWEGIAKCSKVSPQIQVSGVPAGTTHFKVSLKDLDAPRWDHGGGTVKNDNSGIIPQGALQEGYNGPCPPSGSHRYRFTVKAINAQGEVLAVGKATQRFP